VAIAVEHLHRQHKVLSLVRVGDEKRLGRTVLLAIEIQLLHVLVTAPDPDEGAQLRSLFALALLQHLLVPPTPAAPEEINARRWAEEALLIAVGLLGHLDNTQITHTVVQENSISTNWYPDYRQIISKPQAMQLC